jgi:hypothetical protein
LVVNNSILANAEVNVLQAINLTLGTSVFVALADAIPKMMNLSAPISFGRIAYVLLLVFWGVKLLVGNHKSFGSQNVRSHPQYSIFQLVMTVAMGIPLILAAKVANDIIASSFWLALSLSFGLVWLTGLAVFYHKSVGFEWQKFPWWWVVSGFTTAIFAGFICSASLVFDSIFTVCLILLMLVVGLIDSHRTRTFFI